MKTYRVLGSYTISVWMDIEAESEEEALEIADNNGDVCIETEWNGNSVFVSSNYDEEIKEFTLEADGMYSDAHIECIVDDDEDDEDEDE